MKLNSVFVFCTAALLAYSFGVIYVFETALDEGTWEHVFGFTRIVLPDTFLYLTIASAENVAEFLIAASIKNSIGPALVWLIFQNDWYLLSIFNAICFLFALIYVRKLLVLLDPSRIPKYYSISLILTIVCMYYSVGSLKEIPTLLAFTGFVYHFLTKEKTKALLWFLFLALFRFQFAFLILPVYLLSKIRRNPVGLTLLGLLVIGMIFPLLSVLDVFTPDAVDFFRTDADQGKDSLGAQIEFVRGNVFGLSLFAILIRMLQTVLEPLIHFLKTLSFYEEGSLSLYQLHSALVLVLMLRAWVLVLFKRFPLMPYSDSRYAKFGILYSFLAIALFTIGGTGLVSHRFLVPIYGLLLVAAQVNPLRHQRSLVKNDSRLAPA